MQNSPDTNPQNFENYLSYDPLKWPPDYDLALIHMRCVCPGKDNVEGIQCPCCGRFQKIKTSRWILRDILKDFKSYGGGVPSYFQLLKYCGFSMLVLTIVVILFHIYLLETTCPKIHQFYDGNRRQLLQFGCQSFLVIFKLCDSKIIFNFLINNGEPVKGYVFYYLQLFSFVYLIATTIGMKIWLQRVNQKKIIKQDKVYSYFSLMIKNIPKFFQIQDVRKQIQAIVPGAEICQLFFVYEIAELEEVYKRLFDLHFQIEHKKQSIASETGATTQELTQLINQYGILYEQVMQLKKKLVLNNGRAIAVFNNYEDRNKVFKALKINEVSKFCFHSLKVVGYNTQKQHFFADKISEPQQIIWKYIGQSSVTKTWVRIKTTAIGFGFMIAAFLVLYFPIIKVDENNIENHGVVSSVLSILISIVLQVLAIVYRLILLKIVPSRHPSSRQSESYFIVITTVVFHFFFYIIAPGTYFLISQRIPANIKIKQLFVAVLMFLIMTVLVAFIDLRYRIFNGRRKKVMSSWAEWGKYCQARLHQQVRWPGFPIEFKLMVILNIWSFNAFYVFQIPYLMILFVLVIIIVYIVDKKNIYRHYKMQVYQSIDLEISVQRDYIIMFLICVCCGYAVCDNSMWHYIFVGIMFVVSLTVNWIISYRSKQKEKRVERTMTLAEVTRAISVNPKQSMLHQRIQSQFKQNPLILDNASTVSLGSATLQYGYKQRYDSYINQFKNKRILSLLQETYNQYKNPNYNMQADIEEVRRVTQYIRTTHIKDAPIKQEKQKQKVPKIQNSYSTEKVDEIQLSQKDEKQIKRQSKV